MQATPQHVSPAVPAASALPWAGTSGVTSSQREAAGSRSCSVTHGRIRPPHAPESLALSTPHLVHEPLERLPLLLIRQCIQLPQLPLCRLPVSQRGCKAVGGGGGARQAVQQPLLQGVRVGVGRKRADISALAMRVYRIIHAPPWRATWSRKACPAWPITACTSHPRGAVLEAQRSVLPVHVDQQLAHLPQHAHCGQDWHQGRPVGVLPWVCPQSCPTASKYMRPSATADCTPLQPTTGWLQRTFCLTVGSEAGDVAMQHPTRPSIQPQASPQLSRAHPRLCCR